MYTVLIHLTDHKQAVLANLKVQSKSHIGQKDFLILNM